MVRCGGGDMAYTPKKYLAVLDMLAEPTPNVAVPQGLGVAGVRHLSQVHSVFQDPNVVGAGVSEKQTDGQRIGQLSLSFYVKKKLPRDEVDRGNMLPPVVASPTGGAVFTDVIELGTVVPQARLPLVHRNPIQSGYSVGHFTGGAGTVGAIVSRGSKKYVLSNSHVLAESGKAKKGDEVFYPGPFDGGTERDTIAHLASFKPFVVSDRSFTNVVDAALAEIVDDKLGDLDFDIHGAAEPIRVASPKRDMKIVVMGRTSGQRKSVIRDVDFLVQVDYGDDVGIAGFKGQVLCDTYSDNGDSGSIVVEEATGAILGLHFAGTPQGSIFTPMRKVMSALRFRF